MPLHFVRGDITRLPVDAIVNAANRSLLGGGGVDGAIHRAAGPQLLAECRKLGGCGTGEAKCTAAYRLPCRWVIHTVGPVWHGGDRGEREKLLSCYRNSLRIAGEKGCRSLAFPLISAGVYGYPKAQALQAAVEVIADFLEGSDMEVSMVIFHRDDLQLRPGLREELEAWRTPEEPFAIPEEGFAGFVQKRMETLGLSEEVCARRANSRPSLLRGIREGTVKPDKNAALALAAALKLSLPETRGLLAFWGLKLSAADPRDGIAAYFLQNGLRNIHEINEALFAFGQPLLGV